MRSIAAGYLWAALLLLLLVFPAAPNSAGAQVPTTPLQQRAVVLGGGGLTGQAWEIGILKGLRDAGIDLTQADLVVGASAGSVVGVQLRSAQSLDAFYEALLAPPTITSPVDPTRIDLPYFQETSRMWQGIDTTPALRIEVGRRALAGTQVIAEDESVQWAASRLGVPDWPSQPLQLVAVDALDGTRRLIDKTQGLPVERAVAASTALPGLSAPITLGDRRFMDGGVAGTHVDAAAGYRLILGLIPVAGPAINREVDAARAQGSEVTIVRPDAESATARGSNGLDPTRMRVSAEAGLRQAAAVAADLYTIWNDTPASR